MRHTLPSAIGSDAAESSKFAVIKLAGRQHKVCKVNTHEGERGKAAVERSAIIIKRLFIGADNKGFGLSSGVSYQRPWKDYGARHTAKLFKSGEIKDTTCSMSGTTTIHTKQR